MEVLFGVFAALALLTALRVVFSGGNSVTSTLAPVVVLLLAGLVFIVLSREFTNTISSLSAQQVVFYIVAGLGLTGGLGVVFSRDIVHAALFLVMTLLMTAGIFVLVSAEFLGVVQILLYGGAVVILVIFALMLTRARETGKVQLNGSQWPWGLLTAAGLGAVLIIMVARTTFAGNTNAVTSIGIDRIGEVLFNDYAIPFEIASLVLIVALVGAIVIARTEDA
jgi:NADH:ubiquinone oxidoreductase subunit 6 (subunit J)